MSRHTRTIQVWIAASLGLATALAGSVGVAVAQSGVGARYGARDPHTCPDTRMPARGAPAGAQAAQYVTCAQEGVFGASSSLGLVEDVRVQVGTGRPYIHVTDSFQDIDPHQLVYPIRGSYRSYACSEIVPPNGSPGRRGENCSVADSPQATGVCYKTTFGDWRCNMQDTETPYGKLGFAPPQ